MLTATWSLVYIFMYHCTKIQNSLQTLLIVVQMRAEGSKSRQGKRNAIQFSKQEWDCEWSSHRIKKDI